MKLTPIDRLLMVLAAAVITLLAFLALQQMEPQAAEEPAAATPSLCADAVVLAAAPENTPTLEPMPELTPELTPIPEQDKPAYDPAIPLPEDLQLVLRAACEENGVDLALALGVIEVESSFDPGADNGLCYGLMQLNRRYFPVDLPAGENICYGVEYLGQLLTWHGSVEAALTAYNAGHDTGDRVYANVVLAAAERWYGII